MKPKRSLVLLERLDPAASDPDYWSRIGHLVNNDEKSIALARGLSDTVREAAKRMLGPGEFSTERAQAVQIGLAQSCASLSDEKTQDHLRSIPLHIPLPACKAGCNWCCYLMVSVTGSEIRAIQWYIEKKMTPEEQDKLWERVLSASEQLDKLFEIPNTTDIRRRHRIASSFVDLPGAPKKRLEAKIACPFLVDGKCSIYAARPLACRGYTSQSETACKELYETGECGPFFANTTIQAVTTGLLDGLGRVDFMMQDEFMELISGARFLYAVKQRNQDAEKKENNP